MLEVWTSGGLGGSEQKKKRRERARIRDRRIWIRRSFCHLLPLLLGAVNQDENYEGDPLRMFTQARNLCTPLWSWSGVVGGGARSEGMMIAMGSYNFPLGQKGLDGVLRLIRKKTGVQPGGGGGCECESLKREDVSMFCIANENCKMERESETTEKK